MERKFYPENLEHFLKGHADQFKMTPSKKVWHSIYNDLHPGRRWPSAAITLLFVFTLLIVGHLNNNKGRNLLSPENKMLSKNIHANTLAKKIPVSIAINASGENAPHKISLITDQQTKDNVSLKNKETNLTSTENKPTGTVTQHENVSISKSNTSYINEQNNGEKNIVSDNDNSVSTHFINEIKTGETQINVSSNDNTKTINKDIAKKEPQANATNIRKPRRISNVSWTYYFTPSISYRYLSDKINSSVNQKPMMGYEAGTAMNFNLNKKLKFITGVQLNYSGYNIKANNVHPIIATVNLIDQTNGQPVLYSAMSDFGNSSNGEVIKLKNYSIQISAPVGLQYMFGNSDNLKFGITSTLQPTYNITGKTYLLSEDKRNYLSADLMRKWNLNTSLSTFLSFSSDKFNWQVGPQFRYQLLSTYSNTYPVKEHLFNYGVRVAISKSSK